MTWCPKTIMLRENRKFSLADPKTEGLDLLKEAINTEMYTGSLKHNFFENTPIATQTDDRLQLRGKKPHFKRIDKSLSLNF